VRSDLSTTQIRVPKGRRVTIAVASIVQESNDFSPLKTRYENFELVFGKDVFRRHDGALTEMGGFLKILRGTRHKIAPLCAGWSVTGGRMLRADYQRLADAFLKRLGRVTRPEALLLALHGAQTAESTDDVAGHMLSASRKILGPHIPIVVTLDLHANVTESMVQNATILTGYKTYPHIDLFETGTRGAELLLQILSGSLVPTMRYRKLPLIVPAENMQTTSGPFGDLMRRAGQFEQSGAAASVSIFGVQPWLDVPEMGCSVVSVTHNDSHASQRQADELAQRFWDTRRQFDVKLMPVRRALREALKVEGPVVLSEPSDSTGSGSPGDSTGVLGPLVDLCSEYPCAIFLVDSAAVERAIVAGVDAIISLRVGGTIDRKHSRPVRIVARVRLISDGRWTGQARGYNTGIETCMGRSVVLDVGKIRLLVSERPAMTVDPELFRSHGIAPERMRIVVVKSPNGFRAAYEPFAQKMILVDTPGVSTPLLKALPYRRVPRPLYPLDARFRFNVSEVRTVR
jgi:microcystin degradation protein MlrC